MRGRKCLALLAALALGLCACGGTDDSSEVPVVKLSVWCSEANVPFMEEVTASFGELHKDEAQLVFNISVEGEDTCRDTVLRDPAAAADLFCFANDQFEDLCQGDALLEVTQDADKLINDVGGPDSLAAQVVTYEGKVRAYPLSAGNGYFLYYNKAYLTPEDVTSLERITQVAAENGKVFTMDFSSGWYLYSFFKAAGFTLESTGEGNTCDWNGAVGDVKGTDVAARLLELAADPGFEHRGDDGFVQGVQDGTVIAGVNGAWNSEKVAEAWGDDYAAARLPAFRMGDGTYQMCSFTGYKLLGVSAHTSEPQWAMSLASYITSRENQLRRFQLTGECPANAEAARSQEVQKAPAVAALGAQSEFSSVQNVAEPFWLASSKLGITLASGNPDNVDLQTLLDTMTEEARGTAASGG